jgi:hypothetical protein
MKHCLLALVAASGLIAAIPTAVRADSYDVYPPGVHVRVYRGDDRDSWAWRRHEWRERRWREQEMREHRWREHREYPYGWRD